MSFCDSVFLAFPFLSHVGLYFLLGPVPAMTTRIEVQSYSNAHVLLETWAGYTLSLLLL